jgi:primosomal protein N' (replication factor Y)
MDPDVLAARETGEAPGEVPDIYVTTWIGTKPALRPRVSLVGVLDADAFIRRPDFRSAENAYQALAEMAEWAGPASEGGRLLVQCSEPGHHAVQAVVRADHDFFVERELESRRELGYPPFAELVKVTSSGPGAEERMSAAIEIARSLKARVLGPISAGPGEEPDAREILIKCADATPVAEGLRDLLAKAPGGHLKVDVDPR